MKADFSRLRFDPARHYSGVLQQQGRVSLDSDWNEDVLTRLYVLQQETRDIVGGCGVPLPGTAFEITASQAGRPPDDFTIHGGPGAAGHFYLNGILCRLEADTSYLRQADFPSPERLPMPVDGGQLTALVYLEVWPRLVTWLEDESIREIALNGPDTAVRIQVIAQVKVARVQDTSITCAAAMLELPPPSGGTLTTLQPPPSQPPDPCRLPDPAAYTGRENHLYRVEIHDPGDVLGGSAGAAFRVALTQDVLAGATSLTLASALGTAQAARLRLSEVVTFVDDDGLTQAVPVTTVSTDNRTISFGNALALDFRTARNAAVIGGAARFKWSSENASFAVAITAVNEDGRTLTVSSLGRDQATALREGDLVEICNDVTELRDQRGYLTRLSANPDPDQFTLVLAEPLPPEFMPVTQTSPPTSPPAASSPPGAPQVDRLLILRRWEGLGIARASFDAALTPDMNLGEGVEIQFGGSNLHPGDYWQFVARTLDGSVEPLLNARPTGILRARCPLAVVRWTAPLTSPPTSPPSTAISFVRLQDCRRIFPPLIDVLTADPGIHVTNVVARSANNAASDLINDTNVVVDRILGGIDVICDGPIAPATLSRPTCFVTLEFPFVLPQADIVTALFQTLTLVATVSAGRNVISWRPTRQSAQFLTSLPRLGEGERGYLLRLFLKGNFIWSGNPEVFLDGDSFGIRTAGAANTSLRFPSGDRRRGGDFEMWFWLARPEPVTPLVFVANAGVPPILRIEGLTELTGDLTLAGTGGQPTPAGQPVPTYNIQVFLNTTITSAILAPLAPPIVDAVLLIDEPSLLNTTRLEIAPPPVNGVGGQGLSYSTGAAPNVYIARRATPNSIVFLNVPIDAPGADAQRILRIKNIRVNANQLGSSSTGAPSQVLAVITMSGATPLAVTNPQQTVGVVLQGNRPAVRRADGEAGTFTFFTASGINLPVIQNPQTNAAVINVHLDFGEGFPPAFKVRSIGAGSPATMNLEEEAAYDNTGSGALPVRSSDPALPQIGLATAGTRFRALFTGIRAGVRIFVTTRDVPDGGVSRTNPNSPPMNAVLVTADGTGGGTVPPPTTVPPGTGGRTTNNIPFAEVPIIGGNGVAMWEWVSGLTNAASTPQTARFGVIIAAPPLPGASQGATNVRLNLAPVSAAIDAASLATPVPRFIDVPGEIQLFIPIELT